MTIDKAFDQSVAYYDDWMKRALPSFQDLFGVATNVMPFESDAPIRVLDLGAGTGLFSEHVLSRYPKATFVLYDLAEGMLNVAKDRFNGRAGQFEFVIKDYRELQVVDSFDLVISSLSIHHLTHEDKRALFHRSMRRSRMAAYSCTSIRSRARPATCGTCTGTCGFKK